MGPSPRSLPSSEGTHLLNFIRGSIPLSTVHSVCRLLQQVRAKCKRSQGTGFDVFCFPAGIHRNRVFSDILISAYVLLT